MQKFWNGNESSKGCEFDDNILDFLVLVCSHEVADLSANNCSELNEAKQEGSKRLTELFWAAKSVLHHVNTVSNIGQTLPMEDHDTEELAEVYSSIIFVGKIKGLIDHKSCDESKLHHCHEKSSVKDVHLIVRFKFISAFVNFHEGTVRNSVDICSEFQLFKWFDRRILLICRVWTTANSFVDALNFSRLK